MATAKLQFAFLPTDPKKAPKAKTSVAAIPELSLALAQLPKGQHMRVENKDIDANIVRTHVQRAQKGYDGAKGRADVKFVTRTDGDALVIYAVAP